MEDIAQEYQLLSRLKGNSNIVYCDDLSCIAQPNGYGWNLCIKMELLTPMQKVLCNPMVDMQVIDLGMDVCTALIACQKANIVHRDIKPDNIMVSPDGNFKLTDFGVAKTAERTAGGTKTGTYNFMAPEVYNNQPYSLSVDQYSLGMVMYWMLNNRCSPFLPQPPQIPTASQMEEAKRRRFSGVPLPEPVNGSPALKQIVMKACAFRPSDRFDSPKEMYDALAKLMYGNGSFEESSGRRSNGAYRSGGSPDGASRSGGSPDGAYRSGGSPDGAYRSSGSPDGAYRSGGSPDGAYRSGRKSDGGYRSSAAPKSAANVYAENAKTQGNAWDATEGKTTGGWNDRNEATKPGATVGADPNVRRGPVKAGNLDVTRSLKITAAEAASGCIKQVVAPSGKTVAVRIPAGSADKKVISLEGEGKQDLSTGVRGTLFLILQVDKTAADFWQEDKKATEPPVQEKKPDNTPQPDTQAAGVKKRSKLAWAVWIFTAVMAAITLGGMGIIAAAVMLFMCAVGEELLRDKSSPFMGCVFVFVLPISIGLLAAFTGGGMPGLVAIILFVAGCFSYTSMS